ncbi:hypothetical protein [Marivita sp. XM-24bin2]|uniref:hypothetical protein n=1 Tax=Marivita sp. XM-24bin2 TaxID=2133951 RepID=UPI000D7B4725|nr:hypothetical protein [Marivita sp. XM-24bin2]PWL36361.1 MAG: hypothetical protein DCO97_03905 [Marivita sp. XM-24bin2]
MALAVGCGGSGVAPSERLTGGAGHPYRFERLEGKSACAAEELAVGTASCVLAVRLGVGPQFDQSAAYFDGGWKRYDQTNG